MITVGIDCGSQNTRVVVMQDKRILSKVSDSTEFNAAAIAEILYKKALDEAKIKECDVNCVATTGTGRNVVEFDNKMINEVKAAAIGARYINPETRLVISMGADSSRVVKLSEDGKILKYEVNDKCASGAGTFLETMARALQIPVEEMGDASLKHTKEIITNAQCVVFAESEVISLIHQQESIEDIAYGIHMGIVKRLSSLIRRIGVTDHITLIGGPGRNKGLVQCMEKEFKTEIYVPEQTCYVSAIGASLYAQEMN